MEHRTKVDVTISTNEKRPAVKFAKEWTAARYKTILFGRSNPRSMCTLPREERICQTFVSGVHVRSKHLETIYWAIAAGHRLLDGNDIQDLNKLSTLLWALVAYQQKREMGETYLLLNVHPPTLPEMFHEWPLLEERRRKGMISTVTETY